MRLVQRIIFSFIFRLRENITKEKRMATETDPLLPHHVESRLTIKLRVVVFITVTLYTMTTTFVFSFLPHMVKSFGASEIKAGYYSGIIASCVYIGRLCCSMFWGYLADVKGKRFCSVITQSCLFVSTIVFGYSRSIYWAAGARLLRCNYGTVYCC